MLLANVTYHGKRHFQLLNLWWAGTQSHVNDVAQRLSYSYSGIEKWSAVFLYSALLLSDLFCFVIAIVFESLPQGLKLSLPSFTNCICCHLSRRNQCNDEEWCLHHPAVIILFRNTPNPCGTFWIKALLEYFFYFGDISLVYPAEKDTTLRVDAWQALRVGLIWLFHLCLWRDSFSPFSNCRNADFRKKKKIKKPLLHFDAVTLMT